MAGLTGEEMSAHVFDVANQINQVNQDVALLAGREERARMAELSLRAARKAKASAAYVSACRHCAAGMNLLDERDWDHCHGMTFNLWLERAHCELLRNQPAAAQFIDVLQRRGAFKVEKAAVYRLQILLHALQVEWLPAIESGLACLRLFGIDIPLHPAEEQLQVRLEAVWHALGERPIESLIELPRMTDPDIQAIMNVCSDLVFPALVIDRNLSTVITYHMVSLSLKHGVSEVSSDCFIGLSGALISKDYYNIRTCHQFAQLGVDLVEKHDFLANKARAYISMSTLIGWTQSLAMALDYVEKCFRTSIETGDILYANPACAQRV